MAYFAIDYYIREGSANSSGPPKWKQWIFVFLHYQEVQGLFMLTFKTQILSLVSVFASQILPTSTEWQRSDGNISRMCLHAVWALWESTGTRGARTETRPSCCFLSCTGQRSPVPTCLCSFIQNAAVTSLNEALRFDEVTLPGLLLFFFFFFFELLHSLFHMFILQFVSYLPFQLCWAPLFWALPTSVRFLGGRMQCNCTVKGFWEFVWNVNYKEYTRTLLTHPSKSHQSPHLRKKKSFADGLYHLEQLLDLVCDTV